MYTQQILNYFEKSVPIINLLKNYNSNKALADFIAGLTVGLTLIPQCVAYASLAGLESQYGLYSSLCGGVLYAIIGTIPELNIAPTALLSLLTYTYTSDVTYDKVSATILLCFISGVTELLCGLLHLGFLVDFVSTPVVSAFTSAGALTVISSQIKSLLGIHLSAHNFLHIWMDIINNIMKIQKWDALLGVICCSILLGMRQLNRFGNSTRLGKIFWFLSVCRNAIVVIICATTTYCLGIYNLKPFTLNSKVPQGLPTIVSPVKIHNPNATTLEMIEELRLGIAIVPFIAILGNVAIAKAFSKGKPVDASQEMLAVGICNIAGSFLNSYPVNASFSRGAVGHASGVKTPLAGIYSSLMVIFALTFLTPFFCYIPKTTLAAVIICAVAFMIEISIINYIWSINKKDIVPFLITFFVCLLIGIEFGILFGILCDLGFLLFHMARPKITVERIKIIDNVEYLKICLNSSLTFASIDFIREKILKNYQKFKMLSKFVIIDCNKINRIDFTAANCISIFIEDFKKIEIYLIFYQPQNQIEKILNKINGHIIINEQDLQQLLIGYNNNETNQTMTNTETICFNNFSATTNL